MNKNELMEKIAVKEAELKHQENLKRELQQEKNELFELELKEGRIKKQAIESERHELLSKVLMESEVFVKCGKCSKMLPVTNAGTYLSTKLGSSIIIEAFCGKCKINVKHSENQHLSQILSYKIVREKRPAYSKLKGGYPY